MKAVEAPTVMNHFATAAVVGEVVQLFLKGKVGDMVAKKTICQTIGPNGEEKYSSIMQLVKKELLKKHDLVIDAVQRTGYRICSDHEKIKVQSSRLRRQERSATTGLHQMDTVSTEKLTPIELAMFLAKRTTLHAVQSVTNIGAIQALNTKISNNGLVPLSIREAIEAMT